MRVSNCNSTAIGVHDGDVGVTPNDVGAAATRQDIAQDAYYPRAMILTCGRLSLRMISADGGISTHRRVVEALGGRLEVIAHLPEGDIRICQSGNQNKRN